MFVVTDELMERTAKHKKVMFLEISVRWCRMLMTKNVKEDVIFTVKRAFDQYKNHLFLIE